VASNKGLQPGSVRYPSCEQVVTAEHRANSFAGVFSGKLLVSSPRLLVTCAQRLLTVLGCSCGKVGFVDGLHGSSSNG
jgi:hypothetical protein